MHVTNKFIANEFRPSFFIGSHATRLFATDDQNNSLSTTGTELFRCLSKHHQSFYDSSSQEPLCSCTLCGEDLLKNSTPTGHNLAVPALASILFESFVGFIKHFIEEAVTPDQRHNNKTVVHQDVKIKLQRAARQDLSYLTNYGSTDSVTRNVKRWLSSACYCGESHIKEMAQRTLDNACEKLLNCQSISSQSVRSRHTELSQLKKRHHEPPPSHAKIIQRKKSCESASSKLTSSNLDFDVEAHKK